MGTDDKNQKQTDEGGDWSDLRSSPLWARVQAFADIKIRGKASELERTRAELEQAKQLAAQLGSAQSGALTELQAAKDLEAAATTYVKAQLAAPPEHLQRLAPPNAAPKDLLVWLATNQQTLAQIAGAPGQAAAAAQRLAGRVYSGQPRAPEFSPSAGYQAENNARMARKQNGGGR